MVTVQRSLQHASTGSFCGNAHLRSAPAHVNPHARRPLQVRAAVQPDMMVAAGNLAVITIQSAFWTGMLGGAYGAFSALTQPGANKRVLPEVIENFSGTARVGGLMGLAHGTLLNVGFEGSTATMGGVALGLGLYAAYIAAMNQPK